MTVNEIVAALAAWQAAGRGNEKVAVWVGDNEMAAIAVNEPAARVDAPTIWAE